MEAESRQHYAAASGTTGSSFGSFIRESRPDEAGKGKANAVIQDTPVLQGSTASISQDDGVAGEESITSSKGNVGRNENNDGRGTTMQDLDREVDI